MKGKKVMTSIVTTSCSVNYLTYQSYIPAKRYITSLEVFQSIQRSLSNIFFFIILIFSLRLSRVTITPKAAVGVGLKSCSWLPRCRLIAKVPSRGCDVIKSVPGILVVTLCLASMI
ncbi:hypothetical protein F4804DRAFT_232174 [Jackrogersella minutella]|nr:hypothetical protein F4804DRAFT_232174 [Jackrogersella minutella]